MVRLSAGVAPGRRFFFIIAAAIIVSSCAGKPDSAEPDSVTRVWLTDAASVILMPPGDGEGFIDELQSIRARWSGNAYSMNAYLKIDGDGIVMVGMGDMGQELFFLEYTDSGLAFDGAPGMGGLSPEYIVMDLQLTYGSAELLSEVLGRAGLELHEEADSKGWRRTITDRGDVIIEIEVNPDTVRLQNHLRGYGYEVAREAGNG